MTGRSGNALLLAALFGLYVLTGKVGLSVAFVLSTIVGATTGVASVSLAGHAAWADWGRIWLTWWLGDMTGALIVAPLLILWIQNPRPDLVRRRPLEAACLCLVTILVGLAVFGEGVVFFGLRTFLLTFFCTLPLLWAAFRFRQREAAVLIAVLSGIAIWAMLRGSGPFAGVTANESLLLLQSFMRSEEHTSELQSRLHLVCRLLLEKKKKN